MRLKLRAEGNPSMTFIDVSDGLGEPELLELVARALGFPTPEKLTALAQQYASETSWTALALYRAGHAVGVIGLIASLRAAGRIRHISVARDAEREGIGRQLITLGRNRLQLDELYAKTHLGAVEFYRRCGFSVTSSGEPYLGAQRFACRWRADRLQK